MKLITVFGILAMGGFALSLNISDNRPTSFLSNSNVLLPTAHVVSIYLPELGRQCSGYVVSTTIVLTSQSCTTGATQFRIRLGSGAVIENAERIPLGGFAREVVNGIEVYMNDLAKLVLANAVDVPTPVPFPVPEQLDESYTGQIFIIGFGHFVSGGDYAVNPRMGAQVILAPNRCVIGNIRIPGTFCTSVTRTQVGMCPGDSGAVVFVVRNNALLPIGISSFSTRPNDCGQNSALNFHTYIRNHIAWITE